MVAPSVASASPMWALEAWPIRPSAAEAGGVCAATKEGAAIAIANKKAQRKKRESFMAVDSPWRRIFAGRNWYCEKRAERRTAARVLAQSRRAGLGISWRDRRRESRCDGHRYR